ncbi:MAG: hypothetical protein ACE5OS_03055 [Anaerolineae bacterium]
MSKHTLGIIAASAVALLAIALYVLIVRGILFEREQQAALEMQIEPIEMGLAGQQGGDQVLPTRQAELATLQAELEEAQFAFPSEVDSTRVLNYVITAAADHSINLRRVQARDPITATLGISSTYRIFAYNVEVEGELEPISNFIAALELGPIDAMNLDQIYLEALPTPAVYRASLVIQVYVRH